MNDFVVQQKIVQSSIKPISQSRMKVTMTLEKEEKELNFCFDIWSCMNNFINRLYFMLYVCFSLFISSFHKGKHSIQTFNRIKKES